jgi:hypothetical protein
VSLFGEYLSTLSGAGGGASTIVVLANANVSDNNSGVAESSYTLTSSGDVLTETTLNGVLDIGDWINPKSSAPGSYEVRADVVFGSVTGSATGTWLALTSIRSWILQNVNPGTLSARLTVSIRLSGTVLTTATVNLSARVFPAESGA